MRSLCDLAHGLSNTLATIGQQAARVAGAEIARYATRERNGQGKK